MNPNLHPNLNITVGADGKVRTYIDKHPYAERPTERQLEVLNLIANGLANVRIAKELSITNETVKRHVTMMLPTLNAKNRTHAVAIAIRKGFIQ